MDKYINVNMLIRKYIDTDIEKFSNSDVKIVLENLKRNILKESGIDICFCRECDHWKESRYYPEVMVCTYVNGATFTRQHDDFCSRGERNSSERSSE